MKYQIELAETAKADIRAASRWLRDRFSRKLADSWPNRLDKTIATLELKPLRCSLAPENDQFPEEIRELLYGKRKNTYRIVFTIRGDRVVVL